MVVGIVSLQGDFREHEDFLRKMKVSTLQVRLPEDLQKIDRLIIPGGESTTIGKLLQIYNLIEPIRNRVHEGMPIWGTCAGAILMAKHIADPAPDGQPGLALIDITARRNAFGRQLDSFETDLKISEFGQNPFHAVFIRAPLIENLGEGVEIMARLDNSKIVLARQKNILVSCFHPELTADTRLHEYFLKM